MFYIEKKENPKWIEKKLSIVKCEDNKIVVPIFEGQKDKQIQRIAQKTQKIIEKNSNSKKIVLSKDIKKEKNYINYLNMNGIEIADGKWLYEILLSDIVKYIKEKNKMQNFNIAILINDLTDITYENIIILAREYKSINIVTNHIEKFKKIEKELYENEGIIIAITNNKKKSLAKSDMIINVDFPNELINKYKIKDNSIIINIKQKVKINKKRFEGIVINNYEIDYRADKKSDIAFSNKYFLRDLYESELYKKEKISKVKEKIKIDKVVIKELILNNGSY